MERINIMTSCNDGIAQYILPQIASIGTNLSNYDISFYLFHNSISSEKISLIREYSKFFSNMSFNEIIIENIEPYKELVNHGGEWPCEAYFSLCCHEYLPEDVDRILYIDAADVIIDDDISEYYFDDFEDCSIIATATAFKSSAGDIRPFNTDDFQSKSFLKDIKNGIFNSGVYVINVAKLRKSNLTMDDFIYVANVLHEHFDPEKDRLSYNGDQGLLSVAFVGDIKFFAYPKIKDVYYAPYNFCLFCMKGMKELWYKPKVLHYAGYKIRPWHARLSSDEVERYKFQFDFIGNRAPFDLNGKQIELYEVWWHYCQMTPIYNDLNKEAGAYARALEDHFLPLCRWYNELLDSNL